MNRRTEIKVKNAKNFLIRNVFNGRYIVRNTLAATILVTVIVLMMGAIAIVDGKDKVNEDSNTNEVVQGDVPSNEETVSIQAPQLCAMNENIVTMLKDSIAHNETAGIEAVDTVMVTDSGVYKNRFIAVEGGINIRQSAGTDSAAIGYLDRGTVGDFLGASGDWSNIKVGDLEGYVKSEFILTGDEAAQFAEENSYSMDAVFYFEAAPAGDDNSANNVTEATTEATTQATTEATTQVTTQQTTASTTEQVQNNSSEPIVIEPEQRAALSLSQEDINLIAAVVALESGSECYEGQVAVANIIINRLYTGRWGNTIHDVVYAPGQFTVVKTARFQSYLEAGPSGVPLEATLAAVGGYNNIGTYLSYRPTYFLNYNSYSIYTIIGNHLFF